MKMIEPVWHPASGVWRSGGPASGVWCPGEQKLSFSQVFLRSRGCGFQAPAGSLGDPMEPGDGQGEPKLSFSLAFFKVFVAWEGSKRLEGAQGIPWNPETAGGNQNLHFPLLFQGFRSLLPPWGTKNFHFPLFFQGFRGFGAPGESKINGFSLVFQGFGGEEGRGRRKKK